MFTVPTLITSAHDVRNFDCGNTSLNEFLIKYAWTNTSAGIARTFVTTLTNQPAVIGCFSISAGSVERPNGPERVAKGTPQHLISAALLARLAVDARYQGRKIGEGPLNQALLKIPDASKAIGLRAVLVPAKNQRAASFYARYGFTPSPTNSFHLMLLLQDVIKTIENQS